MQLYPVSMYSY